MILAFHMITGAALAAGVKNPGEAITLGLVSHYFLDSLPHMEYKIGGIKNGDLKNSAKEFAKIALDILIGMAFVSYIIWNSGSGQSTLILLGAFFGILPDGFVFLDYALKNKEGGIWINFLKRHGTIHKTIHSEVRRKLVTVPFQLIITGILIYFIFK